MKTFLVLLSLALMSTALPAAEQPSKSIVTDGKVYELRTYIATPGKLEQLHARFRNHTNKLLEKHGMKLIGFWVPQEADKGADNTVIYIVEHASRKAGEDSWKAFRADPEWVAAKAESEKGGPLTIKVDSVFMNPTDYSKLK
ncbi:MAG: NIPSNAP family protein [Verrucomicrobiaceae bacterium]|nr:MAG: NIPSNAP family protein [Verrucomicrobiaceae bacterium]